MINISNDLNFKYCFHQVYESLGTLSWVRVLKYESIHWHDPSLSVQFWIKFDKDPVYDICRSPTRTILRKKWLVRFEKNFFQIRLLWNAIETDQFNSTLSDKFISNNNAAETVVKKNAMMNYAAQFKPELVWSNKNNRTCTISYQTSIKKYQAELHFFLFVLNSQHPFQ